MKIKIKKSECADTRTCDWSKVTKEQLLENSNMHIKDVREGMEFLKDKIEQAKIMHDITKLTKIDSFHQDFSTGFKTTDWWEKHQKIERHHFNDPKYIQDDVNLIDILEQITDAVMAGMARSGEYRKEDLPAGLLQKAYENTINLLLSNVEVE